MGGLIVWGDARYISNPIAYGVVYALILLGIYLCSSADVVHTYIQRKNIANPESKEYKAIYRLYDAMGRFKDATKLMVAHRQRSESTPVGSTVSGDGISNWSSNWSSNCRSVGSRAMESLRRIGLTSSSDIAGTPLSAALGRFLGTASEYHHVSPAELTTLCIELAQTLEKHGDDGAYILQGAIARWGERECDIIQQFKNQDAGINQSLTLAAKLQPVVDSVL